MRDVPARGSGGQEALGWQERASALSIPVGQPGTSQGQKRGRINVNG